MLLLFAVPCFASFYSLQMATNWKNILHNDKFTQIYFECRSICDHITRKTLSWLYYISMKRIWPIEYHSEFNRCIEIVLKSNLNQLISHQNIAHNFQNKVPVSETASNFWYYQYQAKQNRKGANRRRVGRLVADGWSTAPTLPICRW